MRLLSFPSERPDRAIGEREKALRSQGRKVGVLKGGEREGSNSTAVKPRRNAYMNNLESKRGGGKGLIERRKPLT